MDRVYTCEHCQHTFKKSSNLNHHLKTNKACLEIRGCPLPDYPCCMYCGDSYSSTSRVHAHEAKCPKKPTPTEEKMASVMIEKDQAIVELQSIITEKEEEIFQLREQIVELRLSERALQERLATSEQHMTQQLKHTQSQLDRRMDDITSMAKKARVQTTNNIVFNGDISLDLSDTKKIRSILNENLDLASLRQGQIGLARVVVENMLTTEDGKLKYVCTDAVRQHFAYTNSKGVEVKDIQAGHLKQALADSGLKEIAIDRGQEIWTNEDGTTDTGKLEMFHNPVHEVITGMSPDVPMKDAKFRKELARLTTVSTDV